MIKAIQTGQIIDSYPIKKMEEMINEMANNTIEPDNSRKNSNVRPA